MSDNHAMTATITAPAPTEAAEYYHKYISQVGPGDVRQVLETQAADTLAILRYSGGLPLNQPLGC